MLNKALMMKMHINGWTRKPTKMAHLEKWTSVCVVRFGGSGYKSGQNGSFLVWDVIWISVFLCK